MKHFVFVSICILLLCQGAKTQNDSVREVQYEQYEALIKQVKDKVTAMSSFLEKNKKPGAVSAKKLLLDSQKNWEAYAYASCALDAKPAEETPRGSDFFYRDCYIEKSQARIVELDILYEQLKIEFSGK